MPRYPLAVLFLALNALPAYAVPETNYGVVKDLLENRDGFFANATFLGVDNLKISYTKFGSEPGAKGCLVLSPGLGEAALKYVEVAHDLSGQGFSPIYAIDHRGQGFSQRLLPDPQKNSVKNFKDYAADLETLLNNVVLKDSACRGHTMSLLAHSMGGAVAAIYLEKVGANSPFHKVAMSAPMLRISYPSGKTENSVIAETFFACSLGMGGLIGIQCDGFAPGKGPYDPKLPFSNNIYTHSEVRFDFKNEIIAKWPSLEVGGPTVRWVRQAALADKELRKAQNATRIATPVLILQALEDKIVDNSGEDEFCAAVGKNCRVAKVPGANHETLMESDSIRDCVIAQITAFLGSN